MSGSLNKAHLIGHLGKDPAVRTLQNGSRVCNFSVATSESWRDKGSGERKEVTQWHNIVVWNEQLIEVAEKYLKKGSKVYIEGQIETRKYQDQSGIEKYTTEIVLKPFKSTLTMLDSAKPGDASQAQTQSSASYAAPAPAYAAKAPATAQQDHGYGLDDSIPF